MKIKTIAELKNKIERYKIELEKEIQTLDDKDDMESAVRKYTYRGIYDFVDKIYNDLD